MSSIQTEVPAGAVPIPEPPATITRRGGIRVDEMKAWMRDVDAAQKANMPPVTSCPEWCAGKDEGHPWDAVTADPYASQRTHTAEFGNVSVCQDETRAYGATESTYGEVYLFTFGDIERMTLEEAEDLSHRLCWGILKVRTILSDAAESQA